MERSINLKSVGKYHFGKMIDLEKYVGSYFESISVEEPNIINKAIIHSIKYNTDEIYNRTDGYAGRCWTVTMYDSRLINGEYTYHLNFRNFVDLVTHYESEGMKFCQLE